MPRHGHITNPQNVKSEVAVAADGHERRKDFLGEAEVAALLLTLTDADTPVWIAPGLDNDALRRWLAFLSGCPVATDPARAMFAVARRDDDHSYTRALDLGTAEYPDRAATLILELPDLDCTHPLTATRPREPPTHRSKASHTARQREATQRWRRIVPVAIARRT